MRATLGTCCVLLGLLSVAASAPAQVPSLEGETRISGSGGHYADVVVNRPLQLFPVPERDGMLDVSWKGEGDVLGFEIRRTGVAPDVFGEVPAVRFVRIGEPTSTVFQLQSVRLPDRVLEPGSYQLYLMSDKPVDVQLKFPGESGKAQLTAVRPFPFEGGVLTQNTSLGTSFHRRGELKSPGLMWLALGGWWDADPAVAESLELCLYSDAAGNMQGPGAYGPGCPGGTSYGTTVRESGAQWGYYLAKFTGFGPDRFGLGGNIERAGRPFKLFAAAAFASYVDAPADSGQLAPPRMVVPQGGTLSVASRRLTERNGRVRVRVRCAEADCRGAVAVGSSKPSTIRLERNSSRLITLRLPADVRASLRRRQPVAGQLRVRSDDLDGSRQTALRVSIRRAARGQSP